MRAKYLLVGLVLGFFGSVLNLLACRNKLIVLYFLGLLIFCSGAALAVLAFEPYWQERQVPLRKRFLAIMWRQRKRQPRWLVLFLTGSLALCLLHPLFYPPFWLIPFWGLEALGGFCLLLAKKQWAKTKKSGRLEKWVKADLVAAALCGFGAAWCTQNSYVFGMALSGVVLSLLAAQTLADGFQIGWWLTDSAPNRSDD